MIAVAYLRRSTDRQALSLEAQRTKLEHLAAQQQGDVRRWHTDTQSGRTPLPKRAELLAALAAASEEGADTLLVASWSRAGRDLRQVLALEDLIRATGIRLISADGVVYDPRHDTPSDALTRNIRTVINVHEVDQLRERIREALAAKAASGRRAGNIPLGYRLAAESSTASKVSGLGDELEPDPGEQRALEIIREGIRNGLGARRIARLIEAEGIPARTPAGWRYTTVQRVIVGLREEGRTA